MAAFGEAQPSENLYISNLPPNVTDDLLPQIFGGSFQQGRVLPSKTPGEGTCVAVVRFVSLEAAQQVRETMDGAIVEIAPHSKAMQVRYNGRPGGPVGKGGGDTSGDGGWGKAASKGTGQPGPYSGGAVGGAGGQKEMDNLYVRGLPAGIDEAFISQLFSPYGTIKQCKVLPSKDGASVHAMVRMGSAEEAEGVKQLGGSFVKGHSEPLQIDNAYKKNYDSPGWAADGGCGAGAGKGGGWGDDGWGGDGGGSDYWSLALQIGEAVLAKLGKGKGASLAGLDLGGLSGGLGGDKGGGWGGDKGGGWGGDKGGAWGGEKGGCGKKTFTVDESGGVVGEFIGTIKSFNDKNGYGFITCPELAEHGDIFLHADMKKGFQVGHQVKFTAVLTKHGKPQAKDLKSGVSWTG